MARRLGIVPCPYAQPLVQRLKEREGPLVFDLVEDVPVQLAIKLRQHLLHGAFLSPVDYAKDYAMYSILPEIAAVSEGESRSVLIVFRENIRRVTTLAVDPSYSSEVVLASVVFAEKYGSTLTIIPFIGPVDVALQKSDAVLCVGTAVSEARDRTNMIDLVDEWTDLVELPYVHGFWVARPDEFTSDEIRTIVESGKKGSSTDGHAISRAGLANFRFALDDTALSSVNEFYRMAYYHGILKDIPDVKVVPTDPADPSLS